MNRRTITTFSALAVAGAITLGGASLAGATDRADGARSDGPAASATDATDRTQRGHGATTKPTDEQIAKASAAALATVPGTVDHVHAGRDAGYLVIVTRADATRTVVKLDSDFTVTGTQAAQDHAKSGSKDRTEKGTKDRAEKGSSTRESRGSRSTNSTGTAA